MFAFAKHSQAFQKSSDDPRRAAPRVAMQGEQISLKVGALKMRFSLTDLSLTGAAGAVEIPPDPGSIVVVVFADGHEARAVVKWQRGADIGLAFSQPLTEDRLFSLNGKAVSKPRRQKPRYNLCMPATIVQGSETIPATLVNVSVHGLRALVEQPVRPGQQVHIDIPDFGLVTGQVRWQHQGVAGFWVLNEIDVPRLLRHNRY